MTERMWLTGTILAGLLTHGVGDDDLLVKWAVRLADLTIKTLTPPVDDALPDPPSTKFGDQT